MLPRELQGRADAEEPTETVDGASGAGRRGGAGHGVALQNLEAMQLPLQGLDRRPPRAVHWLCQFHRKQQEEQGDRLPHDWACC